jgi:colicin import membrane protein
MAATYSPRPGPRDPHENRNARSDTRHEQGRLPALILALVVHAIFFAILVFSVSWQVKPSAPLMAEVWDSLPPSRNSPAPTPVPKPAPEPEVKPPPPVEPPIAKKPPPEVEKAPPQPTKAEIDLKVKQEREVVEKRAREEKELADKKKTDDLKKEQDKKKEELLKKQRDEAAKMANERALDNKIKEEQAASQARENQARAAQQAAQKAAADGYAQKIAALIRSRANVPDTVVGRPKVQIQLRLLVNGVVFDAKVIKPSGNPVYDEAIERAINGIQTWPLPDKPELLGSTRTLILNIEHER